ncbi:unnamed protein product [Somion occarium]|uniref:Putative gamma-glutamylcyclotransferase n=1 Tax=Somion occarium TaxID=3059160 RepID=A0ABP1D067_9APHY
MSSVYTAFFYGTLMHPSILRRVIGHDGNELHICPALLLDHTRHKIKNADYPGVIPYSRSAGLFEGRELSPDEKSVRGTLVSGLTTQDVILLDLFEGDEYSRDTVSVHPLSAFTPLVSTLLPSPPDAHIIPSTSSPISSFDALQTPILAQTYIWKALSQLEPALWEYEQFIRDSAWKWVGDGSRDNKDYIEVDRRRQMNGRIIRTTPMDSDEGNVEADVGVIVESDVPVTVQA